MAKPSLESIDNHFDRLLESMDTRMRDRALCPMCDNVLGLRLNQCCRDFAALLEKPRG